MSIFRTHELKPVDIDIFIQAMEAGKAKVEEHERMDLEDLPVGQPIVNPENYRHRRAMDNMTSRMLGIIAFFPDDRDMAMSCELRRSYVMKLITKRRFRRYRRQNDDGSLDVHEAFLKAAAGMSLTMSLIKRPKRLQRALLREVRRQVEIEEREEAETEKPSG